jgi:hypothetical protein
MENDTPHSTAAIADRPQEAREQVLLRWLYFAAGFIAGALVYAIIDQAAGVPPARPMAQFSCRPNRRPKPDRRSSEKKARRLAGLVYRAAVWEADARLKFGKGRISHSPVRSAIEL